MTLNFNLTVKGSFTTRTGPIWNGDSDVLHHRQEKRGRGIKTI